MTKWNTNPVSPLAQRQWQTVEIARWKDRRTFVLTGIAPTAIGSRVYFAVTRLLQLLDDLQSNLNTIGSNPPNP